MWIIPSRIFPSSLAAEGSTSVSTELFETLAAQLSWRGKHSLAPSWKRAWKTAPWVRRLSTRLLPSSQEHLFEAWWIASLAEARAKTCPSQGNEPVLREPEVGSFSRCVESSRSASLVSFSGRMSSGRKSTSPRSTPNLNGWGTKEKPPSFELLTWEPLINELESSSLRDEWRTPTASDGESGAGVSMGRPSPQNLRTQAVWQTPRASDGTNGGPNQTLKGKPALTNEARRWPTPSTLETEGGAEDPNLRRAGRHGVKLKDEVSVWPTPAAQRSGSNQGGAAGRVGPVRPSLDSLAKLWPTASVRGNHNVQGLSTKSGDGLATAALRSWPTPRQRDYKGPGYDDDLSNAVNGHQDLMETGVESPPVSSRLNPEFVAWLMGFPENWARPGPMSSECTAMPSSRPRLLQPFVSFTPPSPPRRRISRSTPEHFAQDINGQRWLKTNEEDDMASANRKALLQKLSKAKASGGAWENFKDGKYRLVVKAMALEDKRKETIFKTIFTVMNAIKIAVQSVKTGEKLDIEPNRAGSDVDWIQTEIDGSNSEAMGPANIRRFMMDLFNKKEISDDEYYETLAEMCDLDEEGDPLKVPLELAKGMVIDMETVRIVTKKNKVEIIVPKWSYVKQSEEERIQMIGWLNQVAAQTALTAGQTASA